MSWPSFGDVKNDQYYKATLKPLLFDVMPSIVKSTIFSMLGVDSVLDSDSEEKPNTSALVGLAGPQKKK